MTLLWRGWGSGRTEGLELPGGWGGSQGPSLFMGWTPVIAAWLLWGVLLAQGWGKRPQGQGSQSVKTWKGLCPPARLGSSRPGWWTRRLPSPVGEGLSVHLLYGPGNQSSGRVSSLRRGRLQTKFRPGDAHFHSKLFCRPRAQRALGTTPLHIPALLLADWCMVD